MNAKELLEIISTGETSKVQFKREMNNDDSIAADLIALSNSKGGMILFGIEDKKRTIVGLDYQQLQSYNNRIATIANDIIKPQIFLYTEVVSISLETGKKKILVVEVAEGTAKPYKDKNGII